MNAKKDVSDSKKALDEAPEDLTPYQRSLLEENLKNAEENLAEAEKLIADTKVDIESGKRGIDRAIADLKLHEEAHLDVAAYTAKLATAELKKTKDAGLRHRIEDTATRVMDEANERQDDLLHDLEFGSREEERATKQWAGTARPPKDGTPVPEDFSTVIDKKWKAAKANGFK